VIDLNGNIKINQNTMEFPQDNHMNIRVSISPAVLREHFDGLVRLEEVRREKLAIDKYRARRRRNIANKQVIGRRRPIPGCPKNRIEKQEGCRCSQYDCKRKTRRSEKIRSVDREGCEEDDDLFRPFMMKAIQNKLASVPSCIDIHDEASMKKINHYVVGAETHIPVEDIDSLKKIHNFIVGEDRSLTPVKELEYVYFGYYLWFMHHDKLGLSYLETAAEAYSNGIAMQHLGCYYFYQYNYSKAAEYFNQAKESKDYALCKDFTDWGLFALDSIREKQTQLINQIKSKLLKVEDYIPLENTDLGSLEKIHDLIVNDNKDLIPETEIEYLYFGYYYVWMSQDLSGMEYYEKAVDIYNSGIAHIYLGAYYSAQGILKLAAWHFGQAEKSKDADFCLPYVETQMKILNQLIEERDKQSKGIDLKSLLQNADIGAILQEKAGEIQDHTNTVTEAVQTVIDNGQLDFISLFLKGMAGTIREVGKDSASDEFQEFKGVRDGICNLFDNVAEKYKNEGIDGVLEVSKDLIPVVSNNLDILCNDTGKMDLAKDLNEISNKISQQVETSTHEEPKTEKLEEVIIDDFDEKELIEAVRRAKQETIPEQPKKSAINVILEANAQPNNVHNILKDAVNDGVFGRSRSRGYHEEGNLGKNTGKEKDLLLDFVGFFDPENQNKPETLIHVIDSAIDSCRGKVATVNGVKLSLEESDKFLNKFSNIVSPMKDLIRSEKSDESKQLESKAEMKKQKEPEDRTLTDEQRNKLCTGLTSIVECIEKRTADEEDKTEILEAVSILGSMGMDSSSEEIKETLDDAVKTIFGSVRDEIDPDIKKVTKKFVDLIQHSAYPEGKDKLSDLLDCINDIVSNDSKENQDKFYEEMRSGMELMRQCYPSEDEQEIIREMSLKMEQAERDCAEIEKYIHKER
jgi:hypothetical protein